MNIAIVDDYEIFRIQFKRLLNETAFADINVIFEANNGMDALEKMRMTKVDILFTDIKMPGMNGIELLEHVKEERLCKCTILLSEYSDFEYARSGLILGAFDYLVKPIERDQFEVVWKRAVEWLAADETHEEKMDTAAIVYCIMNHGCDLETLTRSAVNGILEKRGNIVYRELRLYHFLQQLYDEIMGELSWVRELVRTPESLKRELLRTDDKMLVYVSAETFIQELYNIVGMFYPSGMNELTKKAANYVLNHPYERITLTDLAQYCCVNNTYLSHRFKTDMGKSFVDYLLAYKMQMAKIMLSDSEMPISEIADKLGYDDFKYMSKLFKKQTGFTPSDYRKNYAG